MSLRAVLSASLSVMVVSALTTITAVTSAAPAQAAPGDECLAGTWVSVTTCFNDAVGTAEAPTLVRLTADITRDGGDTGDLAVPAARGITLDLAGYGLTVVEGVPSSAAGVEVSAGTTLTVEDSVGGGHLTATGGDDGAGIGGGFGGDVGVVTISGGAVTATGGPFAAGIGTGYEGHAGEVFITAGTVRASGGDSGAGIGGGFGSVGGEVTITGGTVTANGGASSAGIGGGFNEAGGVVSISGGTVTASGGSYGAGIGGGYAGSGGEVSITGGTVTATAGSDSAGIGGGALGAGAQVEISAGAVVTVRGPIGVGAGSSGTTLGSLANAGSLTFALGTTTIIRAGITVMNTGTITVHGTLAGAGGIVNEGTIVNTGTVAASLTVSGNNFALTLDRGGVDFGSTPVSNVRVFAATLADAGITLPQPSVGSPGSWLATLSGSSPRRVAVTSATDLHDLFGDGPATVALDFSATGACTASTWTRLVGCFNGATGTTSVPTLVTLTADITRAAGDTGAVVVPGGKAVTLNLVGHDLTVVEGVPTDFAAIGVSAGTDLTIEDSTGTGTLTATGGSGGAGIGGGYSEDSGLLTINGGTITATGQSASGIGGGERQSGGTTIINGGTVTATAGDDAAGIGGPKGGGSVTINGGTVVATGTENGAGIGSGGSGAAGTITIDGGTVTATGSVDAAGIGSGRWGSGGAVTIGTAATVTVDGTIGIGAGAGGTVFGSLSNAGSLTFASGTTTTIPSGVTVSNTGSMTVEGSLAGVGTIVNNGTIINRGSISGDGLGGTVQDPDLLITVNNYRLVYDNAGIGGLTVPDPVSVYAASATAGSVTVPAVPARTSYLAKGWYTTATAGTVVSGATVLADLLSQGEVGPVVVTLYPQYSAVQAVDWPAVPGDAKVGGTWSPVFADPVGHNPVVLTVGAGTTNSACRITPGGPGSAGTVVFDHAGICELTGTRAGDDTHEEATATVSFAITKTTVGLSVSTPTPVFGAPVSITVTQTTHAAGTIAFTLDGTPVGSPVTVADGVATIDLGDTLAVGVHHVDVAFNPTDTNTYDTSSANTSFTISQAATTTGVTLAPTTLTATVTPVAPSTATPTGDVEFTLAGQVVGTASLDHNGVATLTYTVPAGQTSQVGAIYLGASTHTGSSGSTTRTNPSLRAELSPKPNAQGWHRGPVTITYTCAPATAALVRPCPAPVTVRAQGRAIAITRTIAAADGGLTTLTTRVNIDTTKPVIRVTKKRLPDGSRKVTCVATDALAGIAHATTPGASGCSVTTRTRGTTVRWTARATDKAGNTATRTGRYQRHHTWLVGAPWKSGRQVVSTGRSYTLVTTSSTRPRYYNAEIHPRRPHVKGPLFRRTGTNTWAITVTIDNQMARHKKWNLGIKTGTKLRYAPITLTR